MKSRNSLVSIAFTCCTHTAIAQTAVEWRLEDGGNGHWYEAVLSPESISWLAASEAAISRGGYLATPTSAAENAFILEHVEPLLGKYLGFGPMLGGRFVDGAWRWVTGEPWKFTAWQKGEPSSPRTEPFLHYQRPDMGWNDYDGTADGYGSPFRSSIVEWSADCNGDGVVDFGQIRSGALTDTDGDGVPDACEDGWNGGAPNLVFNGSFGLGTEGWTFANIDFAGGWRESGGQPGAYFILNDAGSPATDPTIEQMVKGLERGGTYRLSGLCRGESSASSPSGAVSFAVDLDGWNAIALPATDTATWREFSHEFVASGSQIALRLRAEVEGTDNDFAIDEIKLVLISTPTCGGDVTGNRAVNGSDLAAVLVAWGTDGVGEFDCDIDNDGLVGGADLAIVLADWGDCPHGVSE